MSQLWYIPAIGLTLVAGRQRRCSAYPCHGKTHKIETKRRGSYQYSRTDSCRRQDVLLELSEVTLGFDM